MPLAFGDQLLPEPGAFYIMDRGFLDFQRLYRFHEAGSFFVTHGKSNLKVERRYSHPVDHETGLICDQSVVLTGFYSASRFRGTAAAHRSANKFNPVSDDQLILFA